MLLPHQQYMMMICKHLWELFDGCLKILLQLGIQLFRQGSHLTCKLCKLLLWLLYWCKRESLIHIAPIQWKADVSIKRSLNLLLLYLYQNLVITSESCCSLASSCFCCSSPCCCSLANWSLCLANCCSVESWKTFCAYLINCSLECLVTLNWLPSQSN